MWSVAPAGVARAVRRSQVVRRVPPAQRPRHDVVGGVGHRMPRRQRRVDPLATQPADPVGCLELGHRPAVGPAGCRGARHRDLRHAGCVAVGPAAAHARRPGPPAGAHPDQGAHHVVGSGDQIRTGDLRGMSPSRCLCATPRQRRTPSQWEPGWAFRSPPALDTRHLSDVIMRMISHVCPAARRNRRASPRRCGSSARTVRCRQTTGPR